MADEPAKPVKKTADAPEEVKAVDAEVKEDPAPACLVGGTGAASVSSYMFAMAPEACQNEIPPEGSTVFAVGTSGDVTTFSNLGETFDSDVINADRSTEEGKPKRSSIEVTKNHPFRIGEFLKFCIEACLQTKEKDGKIYAPRVAGPMQTFTLFDLIKDVSRFTTVSGAIIKTLTISISAGNKAEISIDWLGQVLKNGTVPDDGIPYKVEYFKESATLVDYEFKSILVDGVQISEITDSLEIKIDNDASSTQTLTAQRVGTGALFVDVSASVSLTKETDYYAMATKGGKRKVEIFVEDNTTKSTLKMTLPNATISSAETSTKDKSFVTDVSFRAGVDRSKTDDLEYTAVIFEIISKDSAPGADKEAKTPKGVA